MKQLELERCVDFYQLSFLLSDSCYGGRLGHLNDIRALNDKFLLAAEEVATYFVWYTSVL